MKRAWDSLEPTCNWRPRRDPRRHFGFNTGWPAGSPLGLGNIPQLSFSGGFVSGSAAVTNLGGAIDQPNRTAINTYQWVDNVSHTTARHVFKVGADIRYTQLNRLYDLAFSGQVAFSGALLPRITVTRTIPQNVPNALVDFAEGLSSGALQFVGDSHRNFRTTSFGFFGQDSFKLRKNLTLNYGLRYELNTVLHEAHGRLSTFRPQNFTTVSRSQRSHHPEQSGRLRASGVVTQADVDGIYDPDHNNFAPRVGLAWDRVQQRQDRPARGLWRVLRNHYRKHSGQRHAEPAVPAGLLQCLPGMAGRFRALRISGAHRHPAKAADPLCATLQPFGAA